MSRVLLVSRDVALVAKSRIINESDSADPVAVLQLALSFNVVLTTDKVPHEITPEHPTALIINEETNVLSERRNHHTFSGTVRFFLCCDTHLRLVDIALVSLCICLLCTIPHTWENCLYIVVIDICARVFSHFDIFSFLVIFIINRCTLFHVIRLCHIIWSVKQRPTAVLFTFQIGKHRNSILRLILVDRSVCIGANHQHKE